MLPAGSCLCLHASREGRTGRAILVAGDVCDDVEARRLFSVNENLVVVAVGSLGRLRLLARYSCHFLVNYILFP